jgi:hypothetical protein
MSLKSISISFVVITSYLNHSSIDFRIQASKYLKRMRPHALPKAQKNKIKLAALRPNFPPPRPRTNQPRPHPSQTPKRYLQVKSTLGTHPTRLVNFGILHKQNLTRLNFGLILLNLNHVCSGLLSKL